MSWLARFSYALNSCSMWISLGVFLLAALSLIAPSGYSLGALLLVFGGVAALLKVPNKTALSAPQKWILAAVGAFATAGILLAGYHHLSHRAFELPSRVALAGFVFVALWRCQLKEAYLLWGLVFGALGAAAVALWQWGLAGEVRAEGYSNAIQFGNISLLWSLLLMAALDRASVLGQFGKSIFYIAIGAGLLASLLSGSRGGWLALPVVYLLQYVLTGKSLSFIQILKRIGLVSLALIVLYQFPQEGLLQARIKQVWVDVHQYNEDNAEQTSVGSRWRLWQLGIGAIAEKPLLGWGNFEQLQHSSSERQAEAVLIQFNHMHNDFLDAWVKRGIVGALSYLAFIGVPLLVFMRKVAARELESCQVSYGLMGASLAAAVGVFGLTQAFLTHASGLTLYVFLLMILVAQLEKRPLAPVNNKIAPELE